MWVRGLKLFFHFQCGCNLLVAPHVGAWIETAWIGPAIGAGASHPMWVRGLKLKLKLAVKRLPMSHPMWVRGLKPL